MAYWCKVRESTLLEVAGAGQLWGRESDNSNGARWER